MLKKIIIAIISLVMIASVCSCTKRENAEASETETQATATESFSPTDEPEATAAPTEELAAEETQTHTDKDFILPFLDGGQMIFTENAEEMNGNGAAEFSDTAENQMGSDGYEFDFVPNVNEYTELITQLDEFEGASPLGGQAVFLRFKTTAAGIYFTFKGDNDFGVYFGDEGQPLVFTYTESSPFAFEGDLKISENTWYNMLMAMDSSGVFSCMIYLDADSENYSYASVDLGGTSSGSGYKNQSWQFEMATHEEATITIEHYDVYSYDFFVKR